MNPPVRAEDDLERFSALLCEYPFGGLVLFNGHAERTPHALSELQGLASSPLLVCADIERGAGQQIEGATLFPHAMAAAIAGVPAVREMARITAIEALACGIHITFAPVADVNSDPRNPIIGIRAFGPEAPNVSDCVSTYIEACKEAGLLTAAKHFPGHGNTATDSHTELPEVSRSTEELESVDIAPFATAIQQGVDLVMTAHVAFPALDPSGKPATLSSPILKKLLRENLNFDGAVITDSLLMGAIYDDRQDMTEFAANLIDAGIDIMLDPPDPPGLVEGIVRAVEAKRILEQQLDRSIERIEALRRKAGLRSDKKEVQPVAGISEHRETAIRIAEQAITNALPSAASSLFSNGSAINKSLCIYIKPFKTHLDPLEEPLGGLLKEKFPSIRYEEVTVESGDDALHALIQDARRSPQLLVAAVTKPAAWRAYGLPDRLSRFLSSLIEAAPTTLVAMGDPGLLESFQSAPIRLCTYSDVPASQQALVHLMSGFAKTYPA